MPQPRPRGFTSRHHLPLPACPQGGRRRPSPRGGEDLGSPGFVWLQRGAGRAGGLNAEPLGLRRRLSGKLLLLVKVKPQPRRAGWPWPHSAQQSLLVDVFRGKKRENWALNPICAPKPLWQLVAPDLRLEGFTEALLGAALRGAAMGGGGSGHEDAEGDSPIPPQVAGKSHPPLHAEDGTQVSGPPAVSAISTAPPRAERGPRGQFSFRAGGSLLGVCRGCAPALGVRRAPSVPS